MWGRPGERLLPCSARLQSVARQATQVPLPSRGVPGWACIPDGSSGTWRPLPAGSWWKVLAALSLAVGAVTASATCRGRAGVVMRGEPRSLRAGRSAGEPAQCPWSPCALPPTFRAPGGGAWGEGGARQQGVGECPDPEGLDWLAMRGIHWRGSVQKEQAWCDGRPVPRELRGSASDRGTHEAPATSERSRWGLETSSPLLNRYEISCNDKTNRQIQNEKR